MLSFLHAIQLLGTKERNGCRFGTAAYCGHASPAASAVLRFVAVWRRRGWIRHGYFKARLTESALRELIDAINEANGEDVAESEKLSVYSVTVDWIGIQSEEVMMA